MTQISSQYYSTPIKQYTKSVSFGRSESTSTDTDYREKSSEELKAEKIEKIARQLESTGKPSALKSFTIVAALMSASALTASALSGRLFKFLNGVGAVKRISKATINGIDTLSLSMKKVNVKNKESFKGYAVKYAKEFLNSLNNLGKKGVEDELQKLSAKKSRKLAAIRTAVVKANPDKKFTKEELKKAVQEEIANNEKYRKSLQDIDNMIKDIKGSNLLEKGTRATTATVAGAGALTEAAKDNDNNGVPDCAEYGRSNKEATQKLTAALIDCALDSF